MYYLYSEITTIFYKEVRIIILVEKKEFLKRISDGVMSPTLLYEAKKCKLKSSPTQNYTQIKYSSNTKGAQKGLLKC